jgi:hypothetical protein
MSALDTEAARAALIHPGLSGSGQGTRWFGERRGAGQVGMLTHGIVGGLDDGLG